MNANLDAQSKIRRLAVLLSVSNASTIIIFFAPEPLRSQWPPFVICAVLAIIPIYYLSKGKNWARLLILIGSVVNIMAIPGFFSVYGDHMLYRIGAILEVALTVYLLIVLNRPDVKTYFKGSRPAMPVKGKKGRIVLIILGIVGVLGLLFAAFIWSIGTKAQNQMASSEVWTKELASGKTDQLTTGGSNIVPRFSRDSKKVAYVHSENLLKEDSPASIQSIVLETNDVTTLVQDACFNTYPSWGADDKTIYYIAKCDGRYDIRVFDVAAASTRNLTDDGVIKGNLSISPDAEWLLFLQTGAKGSQDIYIIPTKGGDKIRLTTTTNFLEEPKYPAWLTDSHGVLFQKFTSLAIVDLGGDLIQSIDLASLQLTTVTDLFIDPIQPKTFYIQAKGLKDSGLLNTGLYWISLEQGEAKKVRTAPLMEVSHSISSDGKWMLYSKPTDS